VIPRRATLSVRVGDRIIGGEAPILVQSMTTTTPEQRAASLDQIRALVNAGCELVRLAVPSLAAAEALAGLRRALHERGLRVPLVADVHFNPDIALVAARHVEKVRINPGNFAPDLAAARTRLAPLVEQLRAHGTALRIGVNHGSLPAFIADAQGHGPEALVLAALVYLRLCRELHFDQVVVSIKASNPSLMIAANRLLARRTDEEGFHPPIHLGVTEAGAGRDGALRSIAGIGPLLLEGMGDTIRVSLTGDPVAEIPVCRTLLRAAEQAQEPAPPRAAKETCAVVAAWDSHRPGMAAPVIEVALDASLPTRPVSPCRMTLPPVESVMLRVTERWPQPRDIRSRVLRDLERAGVPVDPAFALWVEPAGLLGSAASGDANPALRHAVSGWLAAGVQGVGLTLPDDLLARALRGMELLPEQAEMLRAALAPLAVAVQAASDQSRTEAASGEAAATASPTRAPAQTRLRWHIDLTPGPTRSPVQHAADLGGLATLAARLCSLAMETGLGAPAFSWRGRPLCAAGHALTRATDALGRDARMRTLRMPHLPADPDEAAVSLGSLLLDGIADGIVVDLAADGAGDRLALADALLQATRRRLSRAEIIACPGCGRLHYDLEATVVRLKARLGHVPGVKIAVMGCIVNGPGEMADADFGYIGTSVDRVDLYAGDKVARRGLTPGEAEDALAALVRAWQDRQSPGNPRA
jgi:(E)-4-hydroxy-3-methylbut-2-enyl-diphosphate synthase